MSSATPVELSRLFQGLDDVDHIAVAVSGGSDSLALLHLLHNWAQSKSKKLSVLTVDHQLRAGSRDEATYVGQLCTTMGIQHHILHWSGDKPVTGIASAARTARYGLMAAHCSRFHIKALALGHTRDDQAETVLMRLMRSDGQNRGLSGMAAQTLFSPDPTCRVMAHRPLLDVSRADLRAYLSRHAVKWVDDPSNEDEHYERVRVRHGLAQEPHLAQKLIDYAAVYARYRSHMALDAALFIDRYCEVSGFDCVRLERSKLDEYPLPVAVLVVQALLSVVGGRDHLPSAIKVMEALTKVVPSTLARVQLSQTHSHLILHREGRHLPSALRLKEGFTLWDQRFWISRHDGMDLDMEVVSGHEFEADSVDILAEQAAMVAMPMTKFDKCALAAMPFGRFCDKNNQKVDFILRSKAASKRLKISRALGAFDRYCTHFDFPLRRALERLFTVKTLNE